MTAFWIALAVLVVVGGLTVRRLLGKGSGNGSSLDDASVRRIEREGRLHVPEDEPLDPEAIAREEERFWRETWDEPDEP